MKLPFNEMIKDKGLSFRLQVLANSNTLESPAFLCFGFWSSYCWFGAKLYQIISYIMSINNEYPYSFHVSSV